MSDWIKWLSEVQEKEIGLVGGKAVNLGKMLRIGLPVPPGFCVTTAAFATYAGDVLQGLLSLVDASLPPDSLLRLAHRARLDLQDKPVSEKVQNCILEAYSILMDKVGQNTLVAVRSSATSEDLRESSFAGLLETYLGVGGKRSLLEKVKACWLALFNERVVTYCALKQINPFRLKVGVIVQEMVDCEKAGTMFTAHPVTGDRSRVVIEAGWGLGETIVSGQVSPDSYVIDKRTLRILEQNIAAKKQQSVLTPHGIARVKVPEERQEIPCLDEEETLDLVRLAIKVESLYEYAQDIEWGITKGSIYILQTRPITAL